MAFPEYQLSQNRNWSYVRDSNRNPKWLHRKEKHAPSLILEEEIYELRSRLELLAAEGADLTSPEVVELSMLLDDKINEYIQSRRRDH